MGMSGSVLPQRHGSVRLFSAFGIDVFVHWSWVVIAALMYWYYTGQGGSPGFFVLTYLMLFAVVVMHEFGHALACRSVGGHADTIVLWPLGGVAYVSPPLRPGAVLWSILAGPLVNLVLASVAFVLWMLSEPITQALGVPELSQFIQWVMLINVVLFCFNMLPVYPLDGGQILQAILWFFIGRTKSLRIAAWVGVVGGVTLGLVAYWLFDRIGLSRNMAIVVAVFIVYESIRGLAVARVLAYMEQKEQQQQDIRDAWRPVHPYEVINGMRRVDSVSRRVDEEQ